MGYNIGPKIGIDGEKEFRQQIKNINDTYKALEAETKAVVRAFDAQGDEQGKLEAMSKQLNKQIEEQRKKQALLEDAVAKASAKYGENSLEATRLRGALYDTQGTIADLENQLQDTTRQLDRTEDGMDALTESTDSASNAAVNFGDIMSANLVADVVMDGLRELAQLTKEFAVGSIETAAEVKAATAQYEQAFGDMQEKATAALAEISQDTNIASTRMQGSFTKIYSFAKTAGADSAEALIIASRAMVAAADSAAYYDTSIEEATERLQAFLKGNYANDAALGISATETVRNAKANELYAKSFRELTESQKVDTLLAMVEAGNKASGAIGQAARESDGWENVMGELAEVFRMLQAEVGKPALKKLTPIIQRITKEGRELIENVDWDAFGDTVEKIMDVVIVCGPAVVKAIASVAAGIVAFKIARRTGELVSLAASFIGVGTAATTAGTAVAASGVVASASPWGAVAAVIGLATSAITLLVTTATDAAINLSEVNSTLREGLEKAVNAYHDAKVGTDAAANSIDVYVSRLKKLEKSGLKTTSSQREYEWIVERINDLIPELNLKIDEQTGLLTRNSAAILADVDAWKKQATEKIQFEKQAAQIEAFAKAEADLADAEARRELIETELESISTRRTALDIQRGAVKEKLKANTDALTSSQHMSYDKARKLQEENLKLNETLFSLNTQIAAIDDEIKAGNAEMDSLKESSIELEKEMETLEADISATSLAIELYGEKAAETKPELSGLTEEQKAVWGSVQNLAASYDEVYNSCLAALSAQIGMFDEVSLKSDWSTEKIMKNWESQQTAFNKYAVNLEKAVQLGLDEALIQQLSDGSTESMLILDGLVNDSSLKVDELNAAFQKTEEAKNSCADAMAGIQSEFASQWDTIVAEAEAAGVDIVDGAVIGVTRNSWKLENAMRNLSQNAVDAYNEPIGRNSPAKEFIHASKDSIDGAVIGVDRYKGLLADAMEDLALYGKNAFLQKKLDIAVSYPDMVASSTIHNSSAVTHMGGFVINITQQPGESADDIAYRCMELIQEAVDSKGAVFGAR